MKKKYGIRDYRGGGRSSAREHTAEAKGLKQILTILKINAFTSSVGDIFIDKPYQELDFTKKRKVHVLS
jgi:chorismate synthase